MRKAVDNRITKGLNAVYEAAKANSIEQCISELEEYFTGDRKQFGIPLLMVGSDFQKNVWNALLRIEYGQTESYSSLSRKIGSEKAIRAVATANGANALAILVPCHRVIGQNGEMTGYAGGLRVKKKLLDLEMDKTGTQLEMF